MCGLQRTLRTLRTLENPIIVVFLKMGTYKNPLLHVPLSNYTQCIECEQCMSVSTQKSRVFWLHWSQGSS